MLLQGLITWGVKLRDNPYPTQSCFFNDGGDIRRPVYVSVRKGSHFAAGKKMPHYQVRLYFSTHLFCPKWQSLFDHNGTSTYAWTLFSFLKRKSMRMFFVVSIAKFWNLKSKSITSNLERWNFRMGKMDRLLGANGRRSTYSFPWDQGSQWWCAWVENVWKCPTLDPGRETVGNRWPSFDW